MPPESEEHEERLADELAATAVEQRLRRVHRAAVRSVNPPCPRHPRREGLRPPGSIRGRVPPGARRSRACW